MGKLLDEKLLLIIFLLVFPLTFCQEEDDDYCDARVRLQMAFIFDKTGTFKTELPALADAAVAIIKDLQTAYPGSEFAVGAFADYHKSFLPSDLDPQGSSQMRGIMKNPDANFDDCYTLEVKFTKNSAEIDKAIRNITVVHGGEFYHESSITAIALAAADKKLGWVDDKLDGNKFLVKRFIAFSTDAGATRVLGNPVNHKQPLLDGTDTCNSTYPPDILHIKKAFELRHGISLIGLYVPASRIDALAYYDNIFKKIKSLQYKAFLLENGVGDIVKHIKQAVEETVPEINCLDPDPPAYNTLGY